jgi:hypothetical protein
VYILRLNGSHGSSGDAAQLLAGATMSMAATSAHAVGFESVRLGTMKRIYH